MWIEAVWGTRTAAAHAVPLPWVSSEVQTVICDYEKITTAGEKTLNFLCFHLKFSLGIPFLIKSNL